jgi:peptidoglycan hydrolase CwlO-like protein
MKKTMMLSFFMILFLSFTFVACNNNRDNETMDDSTGMNDNTGTGDNSMTGDRTGAPMNDGTQVTFWDRNRDYSYEERDTYKEDLNAAVDKLDKQIDNLEDRADNAQGDNKQALEKRIDNLKKQRTELNNKINDWATITGKEWEGFKSDVNEMWSDVQDSYNEVAREISGDNQQDGQY